LDAGKRSKSKSGIAFDPFEQFAAAQARGLSVAEGLFDKCDDPLVDMGVGADLFRQPRHNTVQMIDFSRPALLQVSRRNSQLGRRRMCGMNHGFTLPMAAGLIFAADMVAIASSIMAASTRR
jgi:hypothetical protein